MLPQFAGYFAGISAMNVSDIRDELKHIRLVHFTLTTLSGLLLYLTIAAWSVPPHIYPELLALKDFVKRLQSGSVLLREVNPREATNAEDQFLRTLQTIIDPKLSWDPFVEFRSPFRCMPTESKYDLDKETIGHLLDYAAKEPCKSMMPEQVQAEVTDLQAWIRADTRFEFGSVTDGPYLFGFVLGENAHEGPGNIGRVIVRITHRGFAHPDEPIVSAPPPVYDDREVKLTMTLQLKSYDLVDWLQQVFPAIVAYREVIGIKTLEDALTWAREQRTKEINSLRLSLLGVEVKTTHIGAVGPLVIGATLLYLLAYLRHCLEIVPEQTTVVEESVRYISPWLGAQHGLSLMISVLTVACLPTAVTLLSLYRLSGWSLVDAVFCALFTLAIGGLCAFTGYQLSWRKVAAN